MTLAISSFLLSGCTSTNLNNTTKKQQIPKLERATTIQVLSPEQQCNKAGYTEEQMIIVDYNCMKLEDLKQYMSSNTYYDIKLGDRIENYKFLKKPKDNFEKNKILFLAPLSSSRNGYYNGDLYFSNDNTTTTIVLTRFGLIDTIIVYLGVVGSTPEEVFMDKNGESKIAETKVLNTLKNKYSLFISDEEINFINFWNKSNSLLNGTKYMGFEIESKHLWHFKNGEDNIIYIRDGSYRSTVIYTSNVYNIIDIISKEKKNKEQGNLNKNENSKLNML